MKLIKEEERKKRCGNWEDYEVKEEGYEIDKEDEGEKVEKEGLRK